MTINELIGKRLADLVGPRGGARFGRELRGSLGTTWERQTYYDATTGRRNFRVGELVALARAVGVPAYALVDATVLGVDKITVAEGAEPVPSQDLLDLFGAPGPQALSKRLTVQIGHALQFQDQLRGLLQTASENAATVDRFLRLIQPEEAQS